MRLRPLLTALGLNAVPALGYLPLDEEDGRDTEILLTKETYLDAIGDETSPRRRIMEHVFGERKILAIGVSGEDVYPRSVFEALARRHAERLLGFWIVGPRVSADKSEH